MKKVQNAIRKKKGVDDRKGSAIVERGKKGPRARSQLKGIGLKKKSTSLNDGSRKEDPYESQEKKDSKPEIRSNNLWHD